MKFGCVPKDAEVGPSTPATTLLQKKTDTTPKPYKRKFTSNSDWFVGSDKSVRYQFIILFP